MKKILLVLILIMNIKATAQNTTYSVSKDSVDGGLIFDGPVTFNDLNNEPSFTWLKSAVESYKPYDNIVQYLKTYLPDYTMVIFLGTWCDDSHYLIPRLEKVLQLIDYPQTNIKMYGVDRAKTTTGGEHKKYDVTLVPTIILFKDGKEVGRITETVKKSIEEDISAIIAYPPAH
jgi:thiol-disulfide isomerase/thioredoxin